MLPSKSKSLDVANSCQDPQSPPSPAHTPAPASAPTLDHDPDPVLSDLDPAVGTGSTLQQELQSSLCLKDECDEVGETPKNHAEFDDPTDRCSELGGKGDESNEKNWTWSDNWDEPVDWNENVKDSDYEKVRQDGVGLTNNFERNMGKMYQYPVRPEAEDCAFYLKTGTCKFGPNCKFNHPVKRKNQAVKEKAREKEDSTERLGQTECKFYLKSGGCKYGKTCRYNHTRGKNSASLTLELNFLGLPIRQGEKECPYYMRNGSCKYGAGCKFNHPDPTAVGGCEPPSGYGNGGSLTLQGVAQSSMASWSSPRTLNETTTFVPMMLSPTQAFSPQSPEWNGYQAPPIYMPERSMHTSSYVLNNPPIETNTYMHHHHQQMQVDEFPERPGEPECVYFLKTGDCKFKSNCKFHHPKNRPTKSPPPCTLSDKGLPLRPDQNICTHYSRYGICKFGPACKFDHPIHQTSITPEIDQQQSSYASADGAEGAAMVGRGTGNDVSIQQSA